MPLQAAGAPLLGCRTWKHETLEGVTMLQGDLPLHAAALKPRLIFPAALETQSSWPGVM